MKLKSILGAVAITISASALAQTQPPASEPANGDLKTGREAIEADRENIKADHANLKADREKLKTDREQLQVDHRKMRENKKAARAAKAENSSDNTSK